MPPTDNWNGLWRFSNGWNWDSPLPLAGITLETSLSGEIALQPRRKVRFDPTKGFRASHDAATAPGTTAPPPCPHRFCVRVSIASSYGAMSDFDAFVLDRIESKGGVGSDAFAPGGPAPLVNGRLTPSELEQIFNKDASAASASPYNHKRQTSWVLYPLDSDADGIDVVLSFKQLYTLLPGYASSLNASSDGPFYSDDPTDQVILRLNARIAGGFSTSTLLLPLVLEHKGSRLFDVSYTSELLFSDDNSDATNQIALDLTFTRKTYGGMLPWLPVEPSNECSACAAALGEGAFMECLGTQVGEPVFADLLSPETTRASVDVTQTLGTCFSQLSTASASGQAASPQAAIAAADTGLRCFIDSQCPVGESMTRLSDAHVVVFASEPAAAHVEFTDPDYAFRVELSVGGAIGLTTDVISSALTELEVADAVRKAITDATGDMSLLVTASLSNNLAAIAAANKQNEALMDEYLRASTAATASPSSSPPSISSDGSSDASVTAPSGSLQGGGGSLSGGSLSSGSAQGDPMPPPPNQRRRLTSQPVLVDVPAPLFTVGITFHNVGVVPIVTAVTSSHAVSWTYRPMKLALQRAPLNLSKFTYVPPPPSVFFGADAAVDTSSGANWGGASVSGSCVECASLFDACASDEDCRFGVRTYFGPRLQPSALLAGATAVDLSQVLASASQFVPAAGLAKFSALLACLATRVPACDVDIPRMVQGATGAFQPVPPAYLRIEPAKVTMLVDHGASIAVSVGDRSASFVESGAAAALEMFLEVFLAMAGATAPSVDVTLEAHVTSRNAYTVVFRNALVGVPFFSSTSATFEVTSTSPKLLIERQSSLRPPEWQHLLDWTAALALEPTPTGGSGTGSGQTTPIPTGPDAICTTCTDKLSACLQASDCAMEAREFLQTYVSPANLAPAPTLQPDSTYQLSFASALDAWKSRATASQQFLELLNCIALMQCAVGYSLSTASATASVPTTIVLGQRAVIVVKAQSPIEIAYGGWTYTFADTLAPADLGSFLKTTVLKNTASVDVLVSSAGADGSTRYDIRIHRALRLPPVFVASAATQVEAEETLAMFVSSGFAAPSWSSLSTWFNAQATTPATGGSGGGDAVATQDVCTQCLPAIAACLSDATCYAGVHDFLVPQLAQALSSPTASAAFSATTVGTTTTFSMDVMPVLANVIATSMFRTAPVSWSKLSAALTCLASRPCDVGYTTAATQPPATPHTPTYMRFRDATADIVLLEGSVLTVYVEGEAHTFTQPADDVAAFVTWLTQLLNGRMSVNFPVANNNNKPNVFEYAVEFPGQVGMLPDMALGSLGSGPDYARAIVTPPRLWLESVDLAPSWQKLLDLFSLAPTSSTGSSSTLAPPAYACTPCASALSSCFSDPECQYVLKTYAVPQLRAMTATFSAGDTFSTDLASTIAWNVLPYLARDDLFVDVLKCTAASSCADASVALAVPNAHASVFLASPTSTLSLPVGAQIGIAFESMTHVFTDSEEPTALASFLETTVLAGRNARAQVKRTVDATVTPIMAQYSVVYDGLYTLYPPHLFVQSADPMTPPPPGATGFETPWRLEFSSTVNDLARAFAPWIDWLATGALAAVAASP